ncbi:MAG TPA: hypothetical protein DDX57_13890, partial [Bacteroidales bacterium]|nr:hypothetical protein [Bacteroidales bacterium]HCB61450.1 hypothetical protein [Bacteroidales bacterium]
MSNTDQTTCAGTFYDAGGTANYALSESFEMTFTPSTAGQMLRFIFTTFDTESITYDFLKIYDGPSTASPLLGTWGGTTGPGTITATNPTGQLTFVWQSDASVADIGWIASISCVAPPTQYPLVTGSTVTTCSGVFSDPQGSTTNYIDNNGTRTMTFCSGTAQSLQFLFTVFETNEAADNLKIYDGPNTASPLLGTYSQTTGPGTVVSSGTCLTFVWTTDNNNASTPGWAANISCVAPPPANNECANAVLLPVNPSGSCTNSVSGTVFQSTQSAQASACGAIPNDDVWYSFVAQSTIHVVSLTNIAGSTIDMYFAVYSGTCASLTELLCSDNNSGTLTGLTIGQTYYVRVYTWTATTGQTSTFDICTYPIMPATNDECATAIPVTVNPDLNCGSTTSGTVAGATASANTNSCFGTDDDDVWFSFVATETSHEIDLLNVAGSTTDMNFAVYSGTCASLTNILCSDGNSNTVNGLTIGQTYYIRVYTWTSTTGQTSTFDLCIGTVPHTTYSGTCTGKFQDNGGNSDYAANSNYVVTYCATPAGYLMEMDFTAFETESIDDLIIYDGPNTSSPIIGTYSGTTSPGTVTSTGSCLTFAFTSDGTIQEAGWSANIACIAPPPGTNMGNNGTVTTCSGYFYDSGAGLGSYANNENYTMTYCSANAGEQMIVDFTTFSTATGDILTIYDGPNTSSPVMGTYSGTTSPGVVASSNGCLTFVFTSTSSGVSTGWSAEVSCAPPTPCDASEPFCTGTTYNYPAAVGVPDMGSVGCLLTTPNPAWYYLQIANDGDLSIFIQSDYDVDFICWGPFTSLTAACASDLMSNSGISCSYSINATETAVIPNALVGEIYVLLITNFKDLPTNIEFSQTGGTGTTDCSIVAPPISNNGPLCVGQTLNLTVANPVSGATYAWTGPHSFSSTAMNPSHTNIQTVDAGVYSLVITVGGVASAPVTTTVVVNPNPTITATASPVAICNGASSSLTGGSSVAGATYAWNPGGLTGSPVSVSPIATTTYTVTGTAAGCTGTATVLVTVHPIPTANAETNLTYCAGAAAPANGLTGTPAGVTFNWTNSNTAIGLAASGTGVASIPGFTATNATTAPITSTITVTPVANGCLGTPITYTITVNPTPIVTAEAAQTYCAGAAVPINTLAGTPAGVTFAWTNSNTAIGLGASGTGNIPAFTATNATTAAISGTVTITPS